MSLRLVKCVSSSFGTHIHVHRLAVRVLNGWIIALNEDSLHELCYLGLSKQHSSSGIVGHIPVRQLLPTPPEPITAM
jgi:hypothetical protein